jgi:hypothetical protein
VKPPLKVEDALRSVIGKPYLAVARQLEDILRASDIDRRVFGRVNQKASLEANSESDRGIAERLANSFDASLTAARVAVGLPSTRSLSPRNAAQRFFCPNRYKCEWNPQDKRVTFGAPIVEFWLEEGNARVRHKRHHTHEGLCTALVSDSGIGIDREEMPRTVLDLNSDSKLRIFEAIGQFGHGGSSSLAFCESVLVVSQPRGSVRPTEFYWTLIVPERSVGDSKQELVRYWFSDSHGTPLVADVADFPMLKPYLPGTAIWHFGYSRGGWVKKIAGPEQTSPWGRLGRLFFSYPLPFYVRGELAGTDSREHRLLRGAFFRLGDSDTVEHRSGEKVDSLILSGTKFGEFHVFVFVLKEASKVRDYVDQNHPVIGTLDGQNHGEMTRTIIAKAGFPELSTSTIIEIRLDALDLEAKSNIIANSRETFKRTEFTRELEDRLIAMLESDDVLRDLEMKRQEAKAKEASADMSKRLSAFLSEVLSDARGRPGIRGGSGAPGEGRHKPLKPLPIIEAADPPNILKFVFDTPLRVPEGMRKLARFKSDARPPKYSFGGDNPRLFAELRPTGEYREKVSITGWADVNNNGYGSVIVSCAENAASPVRKETPAGELHLTLQSAAGRTLHTTLPVVVAPRPKIEARQREPEVRVEVTFSCPDPEQRGELASLFGVEHVAAPGSGLSRVCEELDLEPSQAACFGDRSDLGDSILRVEINAANPALRDLMTTSRTTEERIAAKDRYCRDVVLDCYQHLFEMETIPEEIRMAFETSTIPEDRRTAEVYLNHEKAIRIARTERERDRAGT